MNRTRRNTLALLGGGVVLAAGAGAAGFVSTRTPTRALAPWAMAADYDDPRLRALSHAILAPNPHNLQPWMAELVGPDAVAIHRDATRALPETDPFDRQITIGFGCFLEQLAIAASVDGLVVETDLFPAGPDGPVALARFAPGADPDPLAAHILARRSCKEPFDMARVVPTGDLAALRAAAAPGAPIDGTSEAAPAAALRDLIWRAWEIEALTPRTFAESIDLLRVGKLEIEATPDGIDLRNPMAEAARRLGLLDRAALLDTEGQGFTATMEQFRATFDATPAFIWVTTAGNTRADQIAAGRTWVRLNLAATGAGLALQPVSQALQEYPEMAGPYAEAHEMLGAPGETVQMLGRLGYGPDVPPAPRWPLEAKLIDASET